MTQEAIKPIPNPKDTLVCYKGGGYDGCFWEWNYFLFDGDGEFHNIFSSGYAGLDTVEGALKLLADLSGDEDGKVFITDLTSEDDIMEFQDDTNEGSVIGITKKVNEIYGEEKMWWECDYCKKRVTEGIPHGYYCEGGIHISAGKKACESCDSQHTCFRCGEFHEDASDANVNDEDNCIYCVEDKDSEE